jgi:hypothetical protein
VGHDHFLPYPFQFVLQGHPNILIYINYAVERMPLNS